MALVVGYKNQYELGYHCADLPSMVAGMLRGLVFFLTVIIVLVKAVFAVWERSPGWNSLGAA